MLSKASPSSGSGGAIWRSPSGPLVRLCQFESTSRTISPKASITSTKKGPRRRIVIMPTSAAHATTSAIEIGAASQKLKPSLVRSSVDE